MNVLLVLGGPPPGAALLGRVQAATELHVAVDGGLHAFNERIPPHVLIGDLDSAGSETRGPWERVEVADQDRTDLEKTLDWLAVNATGEGILDLTLLGAIGGRSDHFLTNLLVLSRLPGEMGVQLLSEDEAIIRVTPERPLSLDTTPGDAVSLIPLAPCVVTATGVKWELENEELTPTGLISQSNQATGTRVSVRVREGRVWVGRSV